ncbi:MAG: hypothetical protein QOE40_370 [Actinomycetota bacterium]|jgi:hypothetical protein|nr:hypothetical protein [Actinomycetota bacterium]
MTATNVACASQDEPDLDELLGPADAQTLLRAATRAPSLHNSPPWRLAVGPASHRAVRGRRPVAA